MTKLVSLLSSMRLGRVSSFTALAFIVGCASGQSRQGTAEVTSDATVAAVAEVQADVSAIRSAVANVQTEVSAVKLAVVDSSERIAETTQKAIVAVNKTDNSSADKWVNRPLAWGFGAIGVAVAGYVIGKAIWIITSALQRKVRGKSWQPTD